MALLLVATLLCIASMTRIAIAGNLYALVDPVWGLDLVQYQDGGDVMALTLNTVSGSAFQSKNEYQFGRIDIQMKLVAGNSAGIVTTFYLASGDMNHDEVDFEFLGNETGNPIVLHTNVFSDGVGGREQQFYLWFDPTLDFHNYSVIWNPQNIIFLVDNIPIRDFKNHEAEGLPFPNSQPMRVYCSIWDAEGWATEGGRVKTDWSQAPFTAYYKGFNPNVCIPQWAPSGCAASSSGQDWFYQELDTAMLADRNWVQKNYMIYNYCTDTARFPDGFPPECYLA